MDVLHAPELWFLYELLICCSMFGLPVYISFPVKFQSSLLLLFLSSEELPCTCPLCTSDRGSCVSTTEGIQLAKELGATYLELHSLDDFYIGKYFGGVVSGNPCYINQSHLSGWL